MQFISHSREFFPLGSHEHVCYTQVNNEEELLQKIIGSLILGAALVGMTACSNNSDAQVKTAAQKIEDASHADHKHDEAPQSVEVVGKALGIPSGTYTMDKTHGSVTFSYLHKGLSRPVSRINNVEATLILDAENPEKSQIDVTIRAADIDTGTAKFDAHLMSADFFNAAAHPTITFKSTSFSRAGAKSGKMIGDLTMMGVTKSVSFDVNLVGVADGDKPTIGVEGKTDLLRSDFKLGKFVPYVGDKVSISISAEFNKVDGQ